MGEENDSVSAIIEWINHFDEIKELEIKNTDDLLTTNAIAILWNFISDSKIQLDKLETPKNETDWLSILKNLRAIDSVCGPILTEKKFRTQKCDLTSLSRSKDPAEVVKFICPFILVGMQCPNKSQVISNIKACSQKTQVFIMNYIKASNLKPTKQANPKPSPQPPKPQPKVETPPQEPKEEKKEQKEEEKKEEIKQNNDEQKIQKQKEEAELRAQQIAKRNEEYQRIISEKQLFIEKLKQEIQSKERRLEILKNEANKKHNDKEDSMQESILENVESLIEKVMKENVSLKSTLVNKRNELDQAKTEIAKLTGIVEVLSHIRGGSQQTNEENKDLQESITKLEKSIEKRPLLYQDIAMLKQEINDSNIKNKETDDKITKIKGDLRTSIDIATKYEQATLKDVDDSKLEDLEGKSVMELMLHVNALEVELASGTPQEIVEQQTQYKKVITKLDRMKKKIEQEVGMTAEMRNDLQRVQQELIGRRENVEESIAKLTETINSKNEKITQWLALSASLKASKEVQPTLISSLRNKYYN